MAVVLLQPENTDMGTTGIKLRVADLTIYFTESMTAIIRLITILCATKKESVTIKLQRYALLQFLYLREEAKKKELLFRYLILVIYNLGYTFLLQNVRREEKDWNPRDLVGVYSYNFHTEW